MHSTLKLELMVAWNKYLVKTNFCSCRRGEALLYVILNSQGCLDRWWSTTKETAFRFSCLRTYKTALDQHCWSLIRGEMSPNTPRYWPCGLGDQPRSLMMNQSVYLMLRRAKVGRVEKAVWFVNFSLMRTWLNLWWSDFRPSVPSGLATFLLIWLRNESGYRLVMDFVIPQEPTFGPGNWNYIVLSHNQTMWNMPQFKSPGRISLLIIVKDNLLKNVVAWLSLGWWAT